MRWAIFTYFSQEDWVWLFGLISALAGFAWVMYWLGRSMRWRNVQALRQHLEGMQRGEFHNKILAKGDHNFNMLVREVHAVTDSIKQQMDVEHEKALLEMDLNTGGVLQQRFFKYELLDWPGIRAKGFYRPANRCGGDWWGMRQIQPGVYDVFIGDATGHGVGSSLVTALLYSICNFSADLHRAGALQVPPAELVRQINLRLMQMVQGQAMMTFFMIRFDLNENHLTYVNAGHPVPYMVSQDPSVFGKGGKPLGQGWHYSQLWPNHRRPDPLLGWDAEAEYRQYQYPLLPGMRFALFTDGVSELKDNKDKAFSKRRLLKRLAAEMEGFRSFPDQFVSQFSSDLESHWGDRQPEDDICFVIVETLEVDEWTLGGRGRKRG